MKKSNLYISAGAIVLLFLLMLMQQLLMPRTFTGHPRTLISNVDTKLLTATEVGQIPKKEHASAVAYAAAVYAARGKHETARQWFQLGAGEFRMPSVMAFYGDYLTYHRHYNAARHWYNLAGFYARRDRQKNFALILRKKIEFLNASEKKELKK